MGRVLQTDTNIEIKLGPNSIQTPNYWTPLTEQVEVLDNIKERIEAPQEKRKEGKHREKTVRFQLPFGGGQHTRSQKWQRKTENRRRRKTEEKEERLKRGVLNGTLPPTISDSGATSSIGMEGDPYIQT